METGKGGWEYESGAIRAPADLAGVLAGSPSPVLLLDGTRSLPPDLRPALTALGRLLAERLPAARFRSGNAEGTDKAFYVREAGPLSGGTGHTIRVCREHNFPVVTQSVWLHWRRHGYRDRAQVPGHPVSAQYFIKFTLEQILERSLPAKRRKSYPCPRPTGASCGRVLKRPSRTGSTAP
jgi:hypothetical protein